MSPFTHADETQATLNHISETCRSQPNDGRQASYIPELASVDPDLFSIASTTLDGVTRASGESAYRFSMQSISKVVALALAVERCGAHEVFRHVGMEPCAEPFNSIAKLETFSDIPINPFINAGAITISSILAKKLGADAIEEVLDFSSLLAARVPETGEERMSVNRKIYESESSTADRNRSLAYFMHSTGALANGVEETLALYFMLCSIESSAKDLSVIGATIANGGVNPVTGKRIVSMETVYILLGLMSTCGLYNESGEFAVKVGIPAKSGVCGGILCSVPGKMGLAVFSPRLDGKGNSVAGIRALAYFSEKMNLRGLSQ